MQSAVAAALTEIAACVMSPDARALLRQLPAELARRAPLWRQRVRLVAPAVTAPLRIAVAGYADLETHVSDLLQIKEAAVQAPPLAAPDRQADLALFSDWPLPGSLRVPVMLRTLVSLAGTLESALAGLEPELRRRLRRLAERGSIEQVTDAASAARIHRDLMEPFARSRHEGRASIIPEAELMRIARDHYLGVLRISGHEVGAQTGSPYVRNANRTWCALRFGYPLHIFGNPKALADANSLNAYYALKLAMDGGYHVLDFGTSIAAPMGGLLQFKRRRGGELSTFGCPPPIWLRPPRGAEDRFFWRWPLFSSGRGGLVLHVGVPASVTDEALLARLKLLAFAGLGAVRLHAGRALSRSVLEAALRLFTSDGGAAHGRGGARRIEVCDSAIAS
jgi:hypothetical protein